LKISQLTSEQLKERLTGLGLVLCAGPFTFRIQTNNSQISQGLELLYGDFMMADRPDFADFHVRFEEVRSWPKGFCSYVSVEVDGDRPSGPVPVNQIYAVFEGCLNWCVYTHAHQYLIIHAAAIECGGRAAILPAPPGSGKSTLCAALVSRGWRLLTDELTLIETATGRIVPLARPVSLKNESIEVIRNFAPDCVFGPMSPDTIKGTIAHMKPPRESVARVGEHSPAAWLVLPSYRSGAAISAGEIRKSEAFMKVAESSVNYLALGELGFNLVSSLVDEMSCYRLEYSYLGDAVTWFDELSGQADRIHGA
jgi:HprK-related kinase A